jgi:hypothetical protein
LALEVYKGKNINTAYVYVHTRLDNGLPFYVGKGRGNRYKSPMQRNKHWHNLVNKHNGFNYHKLVENIDNEFAYLIEKEVISKYKWLGYPLVNKTDGGEGVSGSSVNLGIPKTKEHKEKLRQANVGKKQSIETIEKRKQSMQLKIKNGWINPFARTIKKGINNPKFKGFYQTPNGIFDSYKSAAIGNNCTEKAVRIRIHGNKRTVNNKTYTYPPVKGWYLIPKE